MRDSAVHRIISVFILEILQKTELCLFYVSEFVVHWIWFFYMRDSAVHRIISVFILEILQYTG